jgi:DNA-binding response OmpR family regulator
MAAEISVLLAEHEPEVAEMSARYLRRDGLSVRLVTAPEAALAELTHGPDAAAVIDLTMPGLDPRHVRRALRTPVVFVAAGPKAPRPRGLSATSGPSGPRRWLGRPFSPRQLVDLVRDVLARPPQAAGPDAAERGAGRLRLHGRALTIPGQGGTVTLTAAEAAVLAALMDHQGRVLSRRQLLAAAGHGRAGDRAADVYIAQLRAKLGPVMTVRTVRGAGYALDLQPSPGAARLELMAEASVLPHPGHDQAPCLLRDTCDRLLGLSAIRAAWAIMFPVPILARAGPPGPGTAA